MRFLLCVAFVVNGLKQFCVYLSAVMIIRTYGTKDFTIQMCGVTTHTFISFAYQIALDRALP